MLELAVWLLLEIVFAYLAYRRVLAYLRYFQQEGYEHLRFLRWANVRSLTDPALWVAIGAAFLFFAAPWTALVLFVAGSILLGALQPDPRRSGKIPLRLTARATRTLIVAIALALGIWMLVLGLFADTTGAQGAMISTAFLLAGMPLVLIAANAVLLPYERHVQRSYEMEAAARVRDVHPIVVGITGSYGKSSSKSMLAHILQFDAPTLAASGSINTLMGITRHIREELVPGHKYMVVEMGAFSTGSIRRLCQLTPPSAGLITAVGDMHLERFGSLDAIVTAKGELAEAIPSGGLLVVNADSPGALKIAHRAVHLRVLLYGEHSTEPLATRLEQIQFAKEGTHFVLRTPAAEYKCFTPLLGRPIVMNLAGAFTLAVALGVDPGVAVAALRTLKPVSNRLEVVDDADVTWIRDAYNSNQFGFRAALEVAGALPAVRRFLATPGVIELGPQQFEVNRALSREASAVCDNTLVVAETNREAFVAGHRDAGREPRLVPVSNRTDAFAWLKSHVQPGDLVILENDLPDLYERSAGLFWSEPAPKVSPS
jgi:UDP-N-acetylmuramoyl-tripeptide--D-alanyl-D-alanine ligase